MHIIVTMLCMFISDLVRKAFNGEKGLSELVCNNLDLVVHAYTHALLSKHPRTRYPVGPQVSKLVLIGMLPDCVSDALLSNFMKFPIPDSVVRKR